LGIGYDQKYEQKYYQYLGIGDCGSLGIDDSWRLRIIGVREDVTRRRTRRKSRRRNNPQ
jgi:hypothetical protein